MSVLLEEYGMVVISMIVFFGFLVLYNFFTSGMAVVAKGFVSMITGVDPNYVSQFF